ncbi:LuxR family transcriptional regulator [Paractinoplanes abujensis]
MLEELDDLMDRSTRGRGAFAEVSGPTAMGKTTVLNHLAHRASKSGSTVLSVVNTPHDRSHPFSGLAQLYHALHAHTPDGDGLGETAPLASATDRDDLAAVARHTHRVVAELAAERHLLITVDDVQHTDEATLYCLRYLAQRLTELSVTLMMTRGPLLLDEPAPRILDDLIYQPSVRRFQLQRLSLDGVRKLAASLSTTDLPDAFVAELHRLSVGNPLLVEALVEDHQLRLAADPETGAEQDLSSGPVFQQVLLACIHRLGPQAVRVAQCVALLGGASTPLLLSRLSGLTEELVRRCLSLLSGVGVLDERLRHPAMRQALLHEMPHDEVTDLRHRAATLLYEDGAPLPVVATHLLNSSPLHEEWVVPVLQEVARQALLDGDVSRSLTCLRLAQECCLDEGERLSVMSQYALGQWQLKPGNSAQHFLRLKSPITAGKLGGTEALKVAEGMMFHLHFDEAMEIVDQENEGQGNDGRESTLTALHGTRLLMSAEFLGLLNRPDRPLPRNPLPATSPSDVRALRALTLALERGADEEAIDLAEQVLQGSQAPEPWKQQAHSAALMALCYADQLDMAHRWYEAVTADSLSPDVAGRRGLLECAGAVISLRRGQLARAAQQAETARTQLSGRTWNVGSAAALAVLVESLTAMGHHEKVVKLLASEPPQALFQTRAGLHYLYARGRHHLATGKHSMALNDFLGCGTLMQRWNVDTPALAPWRLGAAEAWIRLGDRDRAAQLVDKQLAAPESGLTRSRGMTLHTLARLQPTKKQPPILLDAYACLEAGGAWHEAAAVLVDLSRAYQQMGETVVARKTAQRAWRLAKSCGAELLCQALRPTRASATAKVEEIAGPGDEQSFGGLSKSEQRVAVLATQGYSNREIADRLFITVSTVEQHLTRVYRKLGVGNREQLLELGNSLLAVTADVAQPEPKQRKRLSTRHAYGMLAPIFGWWADHLSALVIIA